jgi:hypothetical protein
MALNGDVLGEAIAALLIDKDAPADVQAGIKKLWKSIGGEIVSHFQKNTIVTVETGIPVSTTGSQSAQTGATTGPGTGKIA